MDRRCFPSTTWLAGATCWSAQTLHAAEPASRPGFDQGGYLAQMLVSLLAVLALIALAAWLLRRFVRMGAAAGGLLRVRAGLPLGGRERILLVQAGDTHLLLGVAPGRVQTLHVFDADPAPAREATVDGAASGKGRAFREILHREVKP
ncbi:MAG TPA: flagellar biosynthetic protein FliO [Chromatiales bacterium]|nr:flagellar biosynthetic protein FliO [Chromatiales bacterium]